MKIRIKKQNPRFNLLIYVVATILFLIPVLNYGADSKAFMGFLLGLVVVVFFRRKNFPVICYCFIILCNVYMSYVTAGIGNITVMGLIKILIVVCFSFIAIETRLFKNYFKIKYISIYFFWCIFSIAVFVMNALFFHSSLTEMLWRLVPIYFSMFIVVEIIRHKESADEIIIALIAAAIIYTLVGYMELFQGKTYFYSAWTGIERYRHGILRVGSTLEDANILGLFLLPPVFLLYTNKVQELIGKYFSKVLMGVMLVLLVITSSRSSLVALAVGATIVLLYDKRSFKQILALVAGFVGIISIPLLINSLTTFEAASAGQRFYLIKRAFSLWQSNIVFGIGLTEFEKQTAWLTMCEFMRQLCELGIIAFILYCSFYIFLFWVFKKNIKKLSFQERHDASCILAFGAAFMINSISLDTYYYYIMWIIPALMFYFLKITEVIKKRNIVIERHSII